MTWDDIQKLIVGNHFEMDEYNWNDSVTVHIIYLHQ